MQTEMNDAEPTADEVPNTQHSEQAKITANAAADRTAIK